MQIFLKANEAQSYFTTSWILSRGTEKDPFNWVPWCFSVGNLSSLNSEGILSQHLSNQCQCETGLSCLWSFSKRKNPPSLYCTRSYRHHLCRDLRLERPSWTERPAVIRLVVMSGNHQLSRCMDVSISHSLCLSTFCIVTWGLQRHAKSMERIQ